MAKNPKIRLSHLREIGWRTWDPIGLAETDGGWRKSPFEDEYDSYLLKAAGMIRRGDGDEAAVQYLVQVESKDMGMGISVDAQLRAAATVAAIRADDRLWNEG